MRASGVMSSVSSEATVRVVEAAAAARWELEELAAVGSPAEQAAAWAELWTPAQREEAVAALCAAAERRRAGRMAIVLS